VADPQKQADITTTRLPVNIVIALCYLWGWVSGIVMLLIEKRNRTVRFHACQAILTFGALTVILCLLSLMPPVPFGFIYYSVLAVWAILIAVGAYLWILLLLKAFQGKPYTLPLIGNAAAKLADWFEARFVKSQPQAGEIEHVSEGPKFCVVCGKKLPEKAIFCPECGEKQFHEVLAHIDRLGRTIESEQAVDDNRRITTAVRKALDATVNAVTVIGEKRDPYTAGHQRRVTALARSIAGLMNLSPAQTEGLVVAGQLHDIGKISVPSDILNKPGRLSDGEMTVIRGHSQVSYDILKNIEFPWPVAQIAYQHHERLDGSGYPQGLKSQDILLEAKILCVADVVEAMASHRPYRPALGIDKALDEISQNKGKLYDPEVVDACVKLFKEQDFKFE
jgi:putative nucleotidyltransferase with HDIG domain